MFKVDMEMPKRCFDCPACVIHPFSGGNYCCFGAKGQEELTKEELLKLGRLNDCPLIELK